MIDALTIGSCTSTTFAAALTISGKSVGLLITSSLSRYTTAFHLLEREYTKLTKLPLYGTVGAVIMTFASYSSSNRCRKTSMCSVPKKPNLWPCPSAEEDSRCIVTLLSVRVSFEIWLVKTFVTCWGCGSTFFIDSSNLRKLLESTG